MGVINQILFTSLIIPACEPRTLFFCELVIIKKSPYVQKRV